MCQNIFDLCFSSLLLSLENTQGSDFLFVFWKN